MRYALPALAFALTLAAVPASAEKLTMNLAAFDKIDVAAVMHVVLRQGKQDVTIEQDTGDWSDLKVEVRNGRLLVSRKGDNGNGGGTRRNREMPDYTVVVTAPDLKAITVAAASDVDGRNLSFDKVDVNVSSASSMSLSGSCTSIALNVSTGASFDGARLHCLDAKAISSTGASLSIWVSGKADGNASTGGSIIFAGNPKTLSHKASLGGSISTD